MISLKYFKLIITGKKEVITKDQWNQMLDNTIIPALRNLDMNDDGKITVPELARAGIDIFLRQLH